MASTLAIALEELADLADYASRKLGGPGSTAGTVAELTSLAIRGAGGAVRVLDARELEQIQRDRATGLAAGASAHQASKQNFAKRCAGCSTTLTACQLAVASGASLKCCPECNHPDWYP